MPNIWANFSKIHTFSFSFLIRVPLPNGTLYFPPFGESMGTYYRADVHETTYRCKVSNQAGTILSRDVHISAGIYLKCES